MMKEIDVVRCYEVKNLGENSMQNSFIISH